MRVARCLGNLVALAFALFYVLRCAHAGEVERRVAQYDQSRGLAQLNAVLDLAALEDDAADPASVLAFLRRATNASSPLVAARARWELRRVVERRGGFDEAKAIARELGLVQQALVVGPFSSVLGAELPSEDTLSPEPGILRGVIDPTQTWPSGAPAQIATVRAPKLTSEGVIPLGAWLHESHEAAYVVFGVSTQKAVDAVLWLGVGGAVKVWADGVVLGAHEHDRPLAFDQDAYGVRLSAGRHRFVIRVAFSDSHPELVARFTDDAGRVVRLDDGNAIAAPTGTACVRKPAALVWPSELDRDIWTVTQNVDGARPEAPCARLLASREDRALAAALQCANDVDAQRRYLEQRLDVGNRQALLTTLGRLGLHGRQPAQSEARLLEAAQLPGDPSPARQLLYQLESERGLPLVALGKMIAAKPRSISAREQIASLQQQVGRNEDALATLRTLHEELPSDLAVTRRIVSLLRSRGRQADLEEALRLLEMPHDLRDAESITVERAELLEGLGRPDEAARDYQHLLDSAPGNARIEEKLGKLLLGSQRRDEGLGHLRRALALLPQSPDLRALLAELDHTKSDLRRKYAVDLMQLRERAAKDPIGKTDGARVLYDGATILVHDNGLQEQFVERVVEVADRHGAEDEGTIYVRFAPDSQSVELETARIYKASGEIVENATTEERDLSEPWAGVYYDVRAQVIHLSGVEPGDVVHVAYTLSDHGRRNELGDAFCDMHLLQEGMARVQSVYRLIAPKSRAIYFNAPHVGTAKIEPHVGDEGDQRITVFDAGDVPKTVPEPGMPGDSELDAYVVASTFATWTSVAQFYRGLARTQLDPDADIRRAAQAAVKGKTTVDDKVAAIYDLVVRSTRYVGLEFGVHGYQPYKVTQIWARKFGDCKDKASLLVAMLKEVGVPATIVLLRTRREGAIDSSPPSLAIFDHAIAYVPALDRYLDGTAELSGSTELPPDDQGTYALHVVDGVLHTTPEIKVPPGDDRLRVKLGTDGSAVVEQHRAISPDAAEAWRRQYAPVAQRKERLEEAWAQRSPGAVVKSAELPHLEDREKPVVLDAKITLPRLARRDGERVLAVPVLARDPQLVQTLGRLSKRTHDLLLSHPFGEHEEVTLELPAGAHALAPDDVSVESKFGKFTLHAEVAEGRVTIVADTVVDTRRVTVADYPAFRAFLIAADRAVGGEVRVEMAAGTPRTKGSTEGRPK